MKKQKNKIYFLYDKDFHFAGFVEEDALNIFLQDENVVGNIEITEDVRNQLLGLDLENYIYKPNDNISIVTDIATSFEYIEPDINIDKALNALILNIKSACGKYIEKGKFITLSNGDVKEFTYKLEDQINLNELVTCYKNKEYIFYHSKSDSTDILYSYADIKLIYTELYNNKVYNLIYTSILSEWLKNNLTVEMLKDKENIFEYGYSNDEILAKVNELYEQQKLS